jgi:hypothetical protein
VNLINDEGPSNASAPRRSPSPFFPLLLICAILATLFSLTSGQYQICSENMPTHPISLPKMEECKIEETEKAAERKIMLFLPISNPKKFPIFSCSRKKIKTCTHAVLWFWKEESPINETQWEGLEPNECWDWIKNKEKNMKKIDEYRWENDAQITVEFAWVGEKCSEVEKR